MVCTTLEAVKKGNRKRRKDEEGMKKKELKNKIKKEPTFHEPMCGFELSEVQCSYPLDQIPDFLLDSHAA